MKKLAGLIVAISILFVFAIGHIYQCPGAAIAVQCEEPQMIRLLGWLFGFGVFLSVAASYSVVMAALRGKYF